jgi:hypothetical protein
MKVYRLRRSLQIETRHTSIWFGLSSEAVAPVAPAGHTEDDTFSRYALYLGGLFLLVERRKPTVVAA